MCIYTLILHVRVHKSMVIVNDEAIRLKTNTDLPLVIQFIASLKILNWFSMQQKFPFFVQVYVLIIPVVMKFNEIDISSDK